MFKKWLFAAGLGCAPSSSRKNCFDWTKRLKLRVRRRGGRRSGRGLRGEGVRWWGGVLRDLWGLSRALSRCVGWRRCWSRGRGNRVDRRGRCRGLVRWWRGGRGGLVRWRRRDRGGRHGSSWGARAGCRGVGARGWSRAARHSAGWDGAGRSDTVLREPLVVCRAALSTARVGNAASDRIVTAKGVLSADAILAEAHTPAVRRASAGWDSAALGLGQEAGAASDARRSRVRAGRVVGRRAGLNRSNRRARVASGIA